MKNIFERNLLIYVCETSSNVWKEILSTTLQKKNEHDTYKLYKPYKHLGTAGFFKLKYGAPE